MADGITFGSMLRTLRRAEFITQKQLAERMGDHTHELAIRLTRWETDRLPPPDDDTVRRICEALGVDPGRLLRLAHEPFVRAPDTVAGFTIACRRLSPQEEREEWEVRLHEWNAMSGTEG